jgi:type III secretion protein L
MGLVVLIDRPGYRVAADRKVIKRSEAVIVEELSRAYALAQEQIDDAVRRAQAACAGIEAETREKATNEAKHEAAKRLTIAEIDRKAVLYSLRPVIADLVVDAVTLIAKQADRHATLSKALELLQGSFREVSWARLRVHPDASAGAQLALDELSRDTGVGKVARVVADESLPLDGCVLESELGTVDASLATQLLAIRAAISSAAK